MDLSQYNLPPSVEAKVEMSPMEDIALYILRHELPDIPVYTLIPETVTEDAFILVRRAFPFGDWKGDSRFLDAGRVEVHIYAQDTPGTTGDARGALIGDAVRVAFRDAFVKNLYVPGRGWVTRTRMVGEPVRKTDWATSAGPVQYADLPEGFWRYEAKFFLTVRRELNF